MFILFGRAVALRATLSSERNYSLFTIHFFLLSVQRYEVWKYPPKLLHNSENITNFAAKKENLSDRGLQKSLKQNKTPKSKKVKE